MIDNYVNFYEANWVFRITETGSLLSVIKCFISHKCFSVLGSLLFGFHRTTTNSLSILIFLFFICSLCLVQSVPVLCGRAGAAGHVDSLSLLSCHRENCHPCHSGLWTQHWDWECVCVCVLRRLWQCVGRKERCSANCQKQLNAWTLTHTMLTMT